MINWFAHMYPYTNFHELNLDWVIATVRHGEKEIADFIGVNTIKYADPILWNIELQYEANTVVVDGQTGNAYISVKPVPSGVHLSRTEYWTQIYNYANVVDTLRSQIAHNEKESTTATTSYSVDNLVFVNGELFRVISPMIAGDSFVVGSNVENTTIEHELLRRYNDIGDLSNLNTIDKSSLVNAINEVLNNLIVTSGNLSNLSTTDKSSLVNAINEVLQTLHNIVGSLSNLDTTDKTSIVNAINEVLSTLETSILGINNTIGSLSDLDTTDKTSIVNAINDVLSDIENVDVSLNYADVKKYGAIGDGVTDDTQAFVNAIASNMMVYIPSGTYYLPNGITLTGNGVSIMGAGRGDTIIKTDGSHNAFTCTTLTHFSIRNLKIDTANIGIELTNNTAWGTISDVELVNCTQGIYAHGDYFPTPTADVIEIKIENVSYMLTSGVVTAFHFYCTGDIWLTNCMAQTNTTSGTALYVDTGVSALYCNDCNFIGNYLACRVENAHNPGTNTGGRPVKPHNIWFVGCLFDSSVYTAIWKTCFDISATDCWFGGSQHSGIQIEGDVTSFTINGCRIHANGEHGIWLIHSTLTKAYAVISNNRIFNNANRGIVVKYGRYYTITGNVLNNNTDGGLLIDTDCYDIGVVGNYIDDVSATGAVARRCYLMANVPISVNNSAGYTESTP